MTLIVICLGAVVVLILVAVLAAMRYLKADDGEDFDDLPGERTRTRSDAADRDRRGPGRRPVRDGRPSPRGTSGDVRAAGRGAAQRPPRGYHPGRRDSHQRDSREYADDYADDRGGQRATAGYDDRRGSQSAAQRRQDSLPAVRPRQARGKRADDDGDWPSTDWDELSDVDYWAEVASDKPLTTTAQPAAQARPVRPEQGRDAGARPAQSARPGSAAQREPAQREPVPRLPVRGQRQPAAAAPAAAVRQPEFSPAPLPAARPQPDAGQWLPGVPASSRPDPRSVPRQAEPSLAMLASLGGQQRPAVPDDDPLTSPSFPKIPASDSRSYHNGRDHTPAAGSRLPAPYNAPTQQFAAYTSQPAQLDSYGTASHQNGHAGRQNGAARPGGYSQPGLAAPAAEHPAPQPYRSSPPPAPAPPAASPAPGGYRGRGDLPDPLAGANGYSAGQLPAAGNAVPALPPRAAGNPYGSYVSSPAVPSGPPNSASFPASGMPGPYHSFAADQGTGQREASYTQPAPRGEIPVAGGSGNGGWYPAAAAGPAAAYPGIPPHPAGPGSQDTGYLNGSARPERAAYPADPELPGYLPAGYPALPADGAGYAGPDPYGRDPYGGYPGYGTDR